MERWRRGVARPGQLLGPACVCSLAAELALSGRLNAGPAVLRMLSSAGRDRIREGDQGSRGGGAMPLGTQGLALGMGPLSGRHHAWGGCHSWCPHKEF